MSAHPQPTSDAPDYSHLPKKHCLNCPKFFRLTKKTRRFCSDECRKEFHVYGSSFGKLKDKLTELIHAQSRDIVNTEFGRYVSGKDFKRAMAAAGFIHRSQIIKRQANTRPTSLLRQIQAQAGLIQNLNQRLASIEQAIDRAQQTPRSEAPQLEPAAKTEAAISDTAIAGLKAFNAARQRHGL